MQAVQCDGKPQRSRLQAAILLRRDGRAAHLAHAGLVLALSTFIVFGPAVGQVFGRHYDFLREWIMFSGSGIGVLKGRFVLHTPQGPDRSMTPLEVIGLPTYPDDSNGDFGGLVFDAGDLRTLAAATCDRRADASRLSFEGWVGTRRGWRPLDVEDVCALRAPAAGERSRDRGLVL